jgi:hypothetical protein
MTVKNQLMRDLSNVSFNKKIRILRMFEENERIHIQQCSGNTLISIITQLLGHGKTESSAPVG